MPPMPCLLLLCALLSLRPASADPVPLRADIGVRLIAPVGNNVFRIARDPRDHTLYIQAHGGTISRVDIPREDQRAVETIARGRRDAAGNFTWTLLRPAEGVPAEVPLQAIRDAAAASTVRASDPSDGARTYALSTTNGNIVDLPRTVVATPQDYGLEFAGSLHISVDGTFYVTLDLERANATRIVPVASSADHGFTDVQGFDIGPDGTFFIGAITRDGGRVNNIARGVLDGSGGRTWSLVARTEPIPPGTKNHPHPGIVLSPDGRYVFLNSGSRTDHGEMSPAPGYPDDTREVPLSSAILRVPADATGIVIPADGEALRASGFLYADGFRNAFDMAFAPNGDLFAADNGPDSDLPDALMWVREGHHYGFPWRMGGIDNPQRFPGYDPAQDNYILFTSSGARGDGLFTNDPGFPPPPQTFTDPVLNLGPDADRLRDPVSGEVLDASDTGVPLRTFTPHSSPLGVVFDVDGAMGAEFSGDGFLLRTGGDCCNLINSFGDPDEDLLHLDLRKVSGEYQARVTRLVAGFRGPMDAEVVGHRIYVIERSGPRGLWEITLPAGRMTAVQESSIESSNRPMAVALGQNYPNPFNPETVIPYRLAESARIELSIYDLAGQRLITLVDGVQEAGRQQARWDGRDAHGIKVASGVYLYRLRVGQKHTTRRLTLLK